MAELTLVPKAKEVAKAEIKQYKQSVSHPLQSGSSANKDYIKTTQIVFRNPMSYVEIKTNSVDNRFTTTNDPNTTREFSKLDNKKILNGETYHWFDYIYGDFGFHVKCDIRLNENILYINSILNSPYNTSVTINGTFHYDLTITGTP